MRFPDSYFLGLCEEPHPTYKKQCSLLSLHPSIRWPNDFFLEQQLCNSLCTIFSASSLWGDQFTCQLLLYYHWLDQTSLTYISLLSTLLFRKSLGGLSKVQVSPFTIQQYYEPLVEHNFDVVACGHELVSVGPQ